MSRIYCGRLQLTAMLPPSRCFGHCRRRCAFGYREGEVEEGPFPRCKSSCWDYHICKESQPKPNYFATATGCGVDPNYEGCLLTLHESYSFWYDVFSCWVYSKPIHNQVSEFCTSFGPLGRFGILFDAGVLVPCNVFFPKLCPSRVITLLFPSDAVYSHNFEIPVFQHV